MSESENTPPGVDTPVVEAALVDSTAPQTLQEALNPKAPVAEEAPALQVQAVLDVQAEVEAQARLDAQREVEADSSQDQPGPAVERRSGPCLNVELSKMPFRPLPDGTKPSFQESVAIMPASVGELNTLSDYYKNVDLGNSPLMAKWYLSVNQATGNMMRGDAFNTTLSRQDTLWRQAVTAEGEQLGAGRPSFTDKTEPGQKLVGPQAVMKIRGLLGMGTVARIPLWHTGMWLNFKAPSEVDMLELERRIADDKMVLGRITNGAIFSNNSVYLNGHVMDFALNHVYEATYRQVPPLELKKLIKVTDLPQLTWGILCAIFPNGYQYRQPCVYDPTKCTHVVEEIIDLTKISWVDDRALTEEQRKHMVKRTAKFTDEQIAAYQNEHRFVEKYGTFELRPGLVMVMKVPTLQEHEDAGRAWVDSVVERTDASFDGKTGNERNERIMQMASASALRQYGQWIAKFVLDEGETVIDDAATIEATLSDLTGQPDVYQKFFDAIEAFINNCTISLIAVPKINCPNCENPMTPEEKAHPHLTTLDVATLFFTLLDQRTNRILAQG